MWTLASSPAKLAAMLRQVSGQAGMVGPRGVADGQSCAVTAVAATDAAASARPRRSLAGHHSIAITTATTASCGVADNARREPSPRARAAGG